MGCECGFCEGEGCDLLSSGEVKLPIFVAMRCQGGEAETGILRMDERGGFEVEVRGEAVTGLSSAARKVVRMRTGVDKAVTGGTKWRMKVEGVGTVTVGKVKKEVFRMEGSGKGMEEKCGECLFDHPVSIRVSPFLIKEGRNYFVEKRVEIQEKEEEVPLQKEEVWQPLGRPAEEWTEENFKEFMERGRRMERLKEEPVLELIETTEPLFPILDDRDVPIFLPLYRCRFVHPSGKRVVLLLHSSKLFPNPAYKQKIDEYHSVTKGW